MAQIVYLINVQFKKKTKHVFKTNKKIYLLMNLYSATFHSLCAIIIKMNKLFDRKIATTQTLLEDKIIIILR